MSATSSTPCPLDGNVRRVVARDRYGVTWRCCWCGQHSREEYAPTAEGDLQRSFDRGHA